MKTRALARALVSVSDKRGIVPFCRALADMKIEILSTGGTAQQLRENGVPVTEVSEYTGFPEIMDGRVKTLHPKIHGGILGRRGRDEQVMAAHGIAPIDLVVVNLYPFAATVASPQCKPAQAMENIDIGGPAMLRAAAKNHRDITVVVDPHDYAAVVEQLQRPTQSIPASMRAALATKTFSHTANYDRAIADYLSAMAEPHGEPVALSESNARADAIDFPHILNLQFHKQQALRYGENPHQHAAFYRAAEEPAGLANARQLQGKMLSFNNIADTDAAFACVQQFNEPEAEKKHACVIVKHVNPCGVAVHARQLEAYQRAFRTDAESAFGGIIAFNQPLQADTARAIIAQQFAEVIIAPSIAAAAQQALSAKQNIRVLACVHAGAAPRRLEYKKVSGGLLVQQTDEALNHKFEVVTECAPQAAQRQDLWFAWKVAKFVKSNAIVYAKRQATVGIGAGQMSRIHAARIAAIKAQHADLQVSGAVLASDAFFPFRDGIDHAAEVGVRAVIQPGGSRRDAEVIAAANEHRIAMIFTAMRHFRH